MLGLPSTTEVGRRLPKEAFYRNLKLTGKQKDAFVHGVERIELLNTIKEGTIHIPSGDIVEEIMVVGIVFRSEGAIETVIDEIAKSNKHKLVFLCEEPSGRCWLAVRVQGVRFGDWAQPDEHTLTIQGNTLDNVWDCIVSQVVFGDTGIQTMSVERRIALVDKVASLEKLVQDLDTKCRKSKQIGKKNEYYAQMLVAQEQLEQARKELG